MEQPDVLDRDHRLVGKGFEESDLLIGERANIGPTNVNHSNGDTLTHQWDRKAGTRACGLPKSFGFRELSINFCCNIFDVNRLAVNNGSADNRSPTDG